MLTLNAIRSHSPCEDGWAELLASLNKTKPDDEPLSILTVLESNGVRDAIWCLRALPSEYDKQVRLFACDVAESVLHIWESEYPNDDRPRKAIEASRLYAEGAITLEELKVATFAARAAADAAYARAADIFAAVAAAYAAAADASAAYAAAAYAAAADASAAYAAAAYAAYAAATTYTAYAADAAYAAAATEREKQAVLLRKHFN